MGKRKRRKQRWHWYTLAFLGVLAIWYGMSWWLLNQRFPGNLADAGVYGDSFGFVNSLLTGLALAGAIIAILMQSDELKHQRTELRLSRRVFEQQAKAQQESEQALRQQAKFMLLAAYLNALESTRQASHQASEGKRVTEAMLLQKETTYTIREILAQIGTDVQEILRLPERKDLEIAKTMFKCAERLTELFHEYRDRNPTIEDMNALLDGPVQEILETIRTVCADMKPSFRGRDECRKFKVWAVDVLAKHRSTPKAAIEGLAQVVNNLHRAAWHYVDEGI